jgi:hypothetical protein
MIFEHALAFDPQTHSLHPLTRFSRGVNMVPWRTHRSFDAGIPVNYEHGSGRLEQGSHRT